MAKAAHLRRVLFAVLLVLLPPLLRLLWIHRGPSSAAISASFMNASDVAAPYNASACISPLCYRWAHTQPACVVATEVACLEWMTAVSDCAGGAAVPLSPLHDRATRTLPFHMYWAGPLPHVAGLAIKSLLATQPGARLTIWVNSGSNSSSSNSNSTDTLGPGAAWLTRHPNITVSRFDVDAEWAAVRHEFPGVRPDVRFPDPSADRAFRFADLARLMILYRYGGVYADADMLFLRDLAPLLHLAPFMYGWACRPWPNNALIAIQARAPEAHRLLAALLANVTTVDAHWFFPADLSLVMIQEQVPIRVLSSYLFDPIWMRLDNVEPRGTVLGAPCQSFSKVTDFFSLRVATAPPALPAACYPAFAFHWHNQWQTSIGDGSVASHVEKYLDALYSWHDGAGS